MSHMFASDDSPLVNPYAADDQPAAFSPLTQYPDVTIGDATIGDATIEDATIDESLLW